MTKYAVLRVKGHQYKVSEGDEILVDNIGEEKESHEVLLLADGGKVVVGKPVIENSKVGLKVLNLQEKGEKIDILKYKAKSRYRRKMGFRPLYTRLLVEKISV